MKKKVLVITNLAPLYRRALWKKLLENKNNAFHFYFGSKESHGIKNIDLDSEEFKTHNTQLHPVKNIYAAGNNLIWQKKVLSAVLNKDYESIILLGNMWVPFNWVAAIFGRFLGKQVIFWSHGFYGNEPFLRRSIRTFFYRLAHSHLIYERRGKLLMEKMGFDKNKLHVVFNSLDYGMQLQNRNSLTYSSAERTGLFNFFSNPDLPTILFIGRLTKIKKIDLLLTALKHLNHNESRINLLLIGDGDERNYLEQIARENGLEKNVHFYGACYSEKKLSKLIASSDLCVSPGNVGLTAIHSLGYGTPVCTHNNFANQMPEVEAITNDFNGIYFEEDNSWSLAEQIEKWIFNNPLSREEIRLNCYKIIDEYYNPVYQCKVIENLLAKNKPFL